MSEWKKRCEAPTFDPAVDHVGVAVSPTRVNSTRHINNILYVAGNGQKPCDVMFVMPTLSEEDAKEKSSSFNEEYALKVSPRYLKSQAGSMFKNLLEECGIPVNSVYVTALCKWLLPKGQRNKPKSASIRWAEQAFINEVKEVKPKIIVCLGKPVFDYLVGLKLNLAEIAGGWFPNKEFDCVVYPTENIERALLKPEYLEKMRVDLLEVKKMRDLMHGITPPKIEQQYRTIKNSMELLEFTNFLFENNHNVLAVDCEWAGLHHVDGRLRSLQLCWTPGQAAYIRFMDDQGNYAFDVPYAEAGKILGKHCNRPEVGYVGHQFAADAPWMHCVIGLDVYRKCVWDTLYALHVIDENADGKLERLALAKTDMGRYDIELTIWKKQNKIGPDEGYGRIPDEILVPYACLRADSLVQLGSGEWRTIESLVKSKYSGTVRAFHEGRVQNCRVTNWHRADVGQKEWYKLITASTSRGRWGYIGPTFTPDHKVLTRRGKVEVKDLVLGHDAILTDLAEASPEQLSIILASLLGDGGFSEKNQSGTGFRFSQTRERKAYAEWKYESLSNLGSANLREYKNQWCVDFEFSKYWKYLKDTWERSTNHARRKLKLTTTVLDTLGYIGLAVWYQDDGVYTNDGQVRLVCAKLTEEEKATAIAWFKRHIGPGVQYYESNGCLAFSKETSDVFLARVTPHMHPCFQYKTRFDITRVPHVPHGNVPFYEVVQRLERVENKRGGDGVRYCLSVEGAENFLTKVGFVSNCRDVDATMRIYLQQVSEVLAQGLPMFNYYKHLFLPFVTDIFSNFSMVGLPMDVQRLDALRELFTLARNQLDNEFRQKIREEARGLLMSKLIALCPEKAAATFLKVEEYAEKGESVQAFEVIKSAVGAEKLAQILPTYEHYFDSPNFNIRSVDMMRRWLFDVKGFTPIKSTNNKEKGLPSMDWAKVMSMPESSRKDIKPSTDKQTLKVLAEKDSLINTLLQLNAVGNLTKAFLREPEYDDDGNIVKEEGLHWWIGKDMRIHGQFSATDTGRPRSWKPNSLNWPSWINDQIARAILGLVERSAPDSPLILAYLRVMGGEAEAKDDKGKWKTPPSIRSNVSAQSVPAEPGSEGWCFVESDYQTAEVRGLAYIAGDPNLIRLINDPDDQFAYTKDDNLVRLRYAPDYGIDPQHQNTEFLMSYLTKEGGKVTVTDADLKRDADGAIVHPKHDLHWNLAEFTLHKPREMLHKKRHRDGLGKTGNFKCLLHNTLVLTDVGHIALHTVKPHHLVWDGLEWVSHEGFIDQGTKHVFEYQGIVGTADHAVYTISGRKVALGVAALHGEDLKKIDATIAEVEKKRLHTPEATGAGCNQARKDLESHSSLSVLWEPTGEASPRERQRLPALSMHGSLRLSESLVSVSVHETTLREGEPRVLVQLPGSRNPGEVSEPSRVCSLGEADLSWADPEGDGLRSDRQQRPLRAREPSTYHEKGESPEHESGCDFSSSRCRGILEETSRGGNENNHSSESPSAWKNRRRNSTASSRELSAHQGLFGEELSASKGARISSEASRGEVVTEHRDQVVSHLEGNRGTDSGTMEEVLRERGVLHSIQPGEATPGESPGDGVHVQRVGRYAAQRTEGGRHPAEVGVELQEGERVPVVTGVRCKNSASNFRFPYSDALRQRLESGEDLSDLSEEELLALLERRGFDIWEDEVGDLLNAGPRHRFTANGCLVSNCAYGSSAGGMERAIEAETGVKPEPGTGDSILKSLAMRQPIADGFLKEMELVPASKNPRLYAASGRIRHLAAHSMDAQINQRIRDAVNSSLGRIARNFHMQSSVADTAARAALWLNEYYRSRGMKAKVCMLLYDSIVTLCPVEERHAVKILHSLFMYEINQWKFHGRILNYPIDTEFNWRWSERPAKKDQKKLDGTEWAHDAALYDKVKMEVDVMRQIESPCCIDDRGIWEKIGRGFTFDTATGKCLSGPN